MAVYNGMFNGIRISTMYTVIHLVDALTLFFAQKPSFHFTT